MVIGWLVACAALALLGLAGAAGSARRSAAVLAGAALAVGVLAAAAAVAAAAGPRMVVPPQPRPFRHVDHASLSCRVCHGAGDRHGTIAIRSAADCAACHHDPGRAFACAACHRQAELAGPRTVGVSLGLSVWDAARDRDLPFDHDVHAQRSCDECHHRPDVGAAVACASCHAEHHRPEADCLACHRQAAAGSHGVEAHLTCTGAGCHSPAAVEPVTATLPARGFCLVCHADQRDHEPGGVCQECHQIPGVWPHDVRAPPHADGAALRDRAGLAGR